MTLAIGFDTTTGGIIVETNGTYLAHSLTTALPVNQPGFIQINDIAGRGIQTLRWNEVTSLDGTFAPSSMADALAYLQGEFAKGPVVGSPERSYALPAATGQPIFPLTPQPVDVNTVALMVNGVAYYPPDTAVSSLAVTWQGPFPLEPTDALRVAYF